MMAKMFYTLDEAKSALGKNEEEIKQLSREGRLREFRDGPRLMFKADQIEALKAELSGQGGEVHDLTATDTGMAIGLADSKGGSGIGSALGGGIGSGIGSAGSGLGSGIGSGLSNSGSGSALGLVDTDAGHSSGTGMTLKEDTALAADLGLSGSVGGIPSPGKSGGSIAAGSIAAGSVAAGSMGSMAGGTAHGSKAGVDVFQNDEIERVDPAAQTAIAPGIGEMGAEGVGSGSGLLDLTRESDDTSLGAELLDEIAPGGTATGRRVPGDTVAGGQKAVEIRGALNEGGRGPVVIAQIEEAPDPMAPAFGGAALGAALVVLFGMYALVSGILDTNTDTLQNIGKYGFLGVAAGGLAVTLVFFVIGLIYGKTTAR